MKKSIIALIVSLISVSAVASKQVTQEYSCQEKNGSSVLEVKMYLAEPAFVSSVLALSNEWGNCEAAVAYDSRTQTTAGRLGDIEIYKFSIGGDCYLSRKGQAAISWKGQMTTQSDKVISIVRDGHQRSFKCELVYNKTTNW